MLILINTYNYLLYFILNILYFHVNYLSLKLFIVSILILNQIILIISILNLEAAQYFYLQFKMYGMGVKNVFHFLNILGKQIFIHYYKIRLYKNIQTFIGDFDKKVNFFSLFFL